MYAYVTSQSGTTYSLVTQLEDITDTDRCEIKDYLMYNNAGDEFRCYTDRSVGTTADLAAQKALYVISQERQ